ncbi:hypothetical protein [Thomasclavelia saccharogumia]|uniref:hypothetical protein n=1 Tax=Thomasclavelia saccharogumia TaxID=341225 RepID=UPI00047E9BFA|nr:hypothetical protein [Thomasclavelia saccharogumia]
MEMIKLKFSLKQITPMIHFQDDDGATIRATELKPKLDRFILSWLAYEKEVKKHPGQKLDSETEMLKNVVNNLENKDWLVDEEHIALNYKMRIKAMNKDKNMDLLDHSSKKKKFLGNADYILKNKKYYSSFYQEIVINIRCFNHQLANKIKELLPVLIDLTAFGLQQGKGYGNFRVSKIDDQEYKNGIEENLLKVVNHFKDNNVLVYKLELDKEKNNKINADYAVALNAIAEYNRILKSGLHSNYGYIPSVIMKKYFKQDGYSIVNEKKAMKQGLHLAKYNIDNLMYHDNEKTINNYNLNNRSKVYYTRGLLGFAQSYQFSLETKENRNKFNKIPRKNGKETMSFWKGFDVKAKVGKDEISRFPSPLHYHVTESYKEIYIVVNNNALISLQNADPKISFRERKYKGEKIDRKKINIGARLPNQEDFNFIDFFEIAGLNKVLYMVDVKNKFNDNYEVEYFLTRLEENQNER